MSDEAHMESAWRHRDLTASSQWHGPQPDEALMEAEEWQPEPVDGAAVMEALMVYLFADEVPETSANASLRLYAAICYCAPWVLVGRATPDLAALRRAARTTGMEPLEDFKSRCEVAGYGEKLGRLFEFFLPRGRTWLETGTWRFYLVARHFQPWFVRHGQSLKELTYEDMARVFEGEELLTEKSRNRARSRWSARAQEVLRKPLEAAGVAGGVSFSKSATARGLMSRSAQGNRNRAGKKKGKEQP